MMKIRYKNKVNAYFQYLMHTSSFSVFDRIVLGLLSFFSYIYGWGVQYIRGSYVQGKKVIKKVSVPVISIGNITAGGTGKTPLACFFAAVLQQQGKKPAVLTRGYGGTAEHTGVTVSDGKRLLVTPEVGGDEAVLMGRLLPQVPVLAGKRRYETARQAIRDFACDVLLLDDGFQHWQLHRDLDIVLIDGTNPFGNGHVLPRGILREKPEQLQRAGLLVLTKGESLSADEKKKVVCHIRQYNKTAPLVEAQLTVCGCTPLVRWRQGYRTDAPVAGTKVIAISALGNPQVFERTLVQSGYQVIDSLQYADHHPYTEKEYAVWRQLAAATGAILVTTEKDAVKIAALTEAAFPLYVLSITMTITQGRETAEKVIQAQWEDKS
ncbi:tetraacyldisaccharide 4'-kinase [Veillonellaceae bacterium DNF00751]|jgi:hypothetical protein|nr:tetraacyldisaccharide 4'-kinase [Megasphaera lornae]KXB90361.1 tetraacyldisaccharide 4'-kinase [Veillonellaceae bacterium DNF00751]